MKPTRMRWFGASWAIAAGAMLGVAPGATPTPAEVGAPGIGGVRAQVAGLRVELGGSIESGAPFDGSAAIEGLDARFDAEIAAGGFDGDALARAYLDAGALAVEMGLSDAAARYLREADLWASRSDLRARARFNFAQVRYREAIDAMSPAEDRPTPDVAGAKARLLEAASAFRAVLDVDPDDGEARRNTERVRRMIRMLDEMEQRAQDEADKMREQADKLDELADRQQQESMENERGSQSQDTASEDQSSLNEETAARADEMRESNPGSSAEDRLQDAQEAQARAQEQLESGDPTGASESQLEAARALREAAAELRDQADEKDGEGQPQPGEQGEPQESESPADGEPGDEEGESESDRLSDWLLDREERQREQRDRQLRAIRGRSVPVERDW